MEWIVILLLSLCLAVGLAVLLVVLLLFRSQRSHGQHGGRPVNLVTAAPGDPAQSIDAIVAAAQKPLSPMEKKYLRLFVEGMTTEDIAATMHVEPSSVYTMKYRIRKKLPKDYILPF